MSLARADMTPSCVTKTIPTATAQPDGANLTMPPVETPGIGLVDLIAIIGKLSETRDSDIILELYELWLRHYPLDPLRYAVCFNYGTLLNKLSRYAEAATALAEAIRLAPDFLSAYVNAGVALEGLKRLDEAIAHWVHVAEHPDLTAAETLIYKKVVLRHLGRAYVILQDYPRAEEALRRCLEIDPDQGDVKSHWVGLRQEQCKWPTVQPWGTLTQSALVAELAPLVLAFHTDDPIYQLSNAFRYFQLRVRESQTPQTQPDWSRHPSPNHAPRPLRIGYVSPDLRGHAIGFLTAELFELHDRATVEVFAYYCGSPSDDPTQARIKQAVDHWIEITGWSDVSAAQRIMDDKIDILVDLGGHTREAPTSMFALRPAPVIVNWLGYPGSMGSPCHQYIIADETIIPSSHEKYYSERVVRLPCYQPTDRKRVVAKSPSRYDVGLPDDAMIYCCFNSLVALQRCANGGAVAPPRCVPWSCARSADFRTAPAECGASGALSAGRSLSRHVALRSAHDRVRRAMDGSARTNDERPWLCIPRLRQPGKRRRSDRAHMREF